MKKLQKYISFCERFHGYNLPRIKFKDIPERYKLIYRDQYGIEENDINKATFSIFLISFLVLILISWGLVFVNIFIKFVFCSIISLIIAYKFNLLIFNDINQKENRINAVLYLIKLNYSLLQENLSMATDKCLKFIQLINHYQIPEFDFFNNIFKSIHEGDSPEKQLSSNITPSEDFNKYITDLLINQFKNYNYIKGYEDNLSEKHFKIYLKGIESKISIIFFFGLFFPIGLCFYIIFSRISFIILIFIIPFFLIFFNYLFKKFLNIDVFLIGVIRDYSNLEKRRFNEFIIFLKGFMVNLDGNNSPEISFLNSYIQNKKNLHLFKGLLKEQIHDLVTLSLSFREMIDNIGIELASIRYTLILNLIKVMVEENAQYSSKKINQLLTLIFKHKKLETKLDLIIKGEKFKLFIFLFLLPLIIGTLGGMLNVYIGISDLNYQILNVNSYLYDFPENLNLLNLFIVFFILLSCNSITSYYFLKIISYETRKYIILISNLLFISTFYISYSNIIVIF